MVFVAVLETTFYQDSSLLPFHIKPNRGVNIPDLELGVKRTPENYNTSEPFFSAYERLLGNQHDSVMHLAGVDSSRIKGIWPV